MTGQTAFHAALLDADLPVPEGLSDGAGRPAGRRYAVYRNNVAVSLRDALETGFPVISKLLGQENFHKIAGLYLRSDPPRSPLMMHYGAGFPAFLETFAPLARLGYLGDVARLELALRRSYHAADSGPVDASVLQTLGEEQLLAARLDIAPAVQIVTSRWPVFSLWAYNMRPGAPKPAARAEDAVVLRPDYDPAPHLLPAGGAAFVAALQAGHPFGAATDTAGADFDLGATLSLLLHHGAITGIHL
ncbi:putative DNA-binding domain-containing protein [Thalassococcus sp. BH17M4-6]|uniref:HvfC/BufC family peptide modification chaperone n=1 Tax=Thalassococcus sp. BH17M4-6 TaxID=3413148 RepID=UPI003BE1A12D